ERPPGTGREAAWSATEQSGMDSATADVKAALIEANRAYEDRFGHVFLIFATGKSDTEMLAAARDRVGNDDEAEREIVRSELGKIVGLRLRKLLDAPCPPHEVARFAHDPAGAPDEPLHPCPRHRPRGAGTRRPGPAGT